MSAHRHGRRRVRLEGPLLNAEMAHTVSVSIAEGLVHITVGWRAGCSTPRYFILLDFLAAELRRWAARIPGYHDSLPEPRGPARNPGGTRRAVGGAWDQLLAVRRL